MREKPVNELVKLQEFIAEHYSLDELSTLCFNLNIIDEELPGTNTRTAKTREIVLQIAKEHRLDILFNQLQHDRGKALQAAGFTDSPEQLDALYANLIPFEKNSKPITQQLLERLNLNLWSIAFVLLFVVIVTAFFLYSGLKPKTPDRMTGDFRIAVAGFSEVPVSSDSTIGIELAEGVFLRLQETIDEISPDFTITIWGPNDVGIIHGKNETERAAEAAQIAEKIGADLIVYGQVDHKDIPWHVSPEFYVSTSEFYEAAEITGPHKLGSILYFIGEGNVAERIETSKDLTARTQILTQIAIGLAYYATFDYEQAYSTYSSIINMNSWGELDGQEIVYLLAGNAALKNNDLDIAAENYDLSLKMNPDYSRGLLGTANIYYRKALQPFEETSDAKQIDLEMLDLAITYFDRARSTVNQPSLANITEKVHFGLGQTFLAQAIAGQEGKLELAVTEFDDVIVSYNNSENQTLRQLAAESHARLGLIHNLSGNIDQAIEEYNIAISLLYDDPIRQSHFQTRVDELKDVLQKTPDIK